MKHARQKILEAVATTITGIGVDVYRSRVYPAVVLPVFSVYALTEQSESENENIGVPRRYTRRLQLAIEILVEGITNYDDQADDYAAQIEAAMAGNIGLSGLATDSFLSGTTIALESGDKPIAKTVLTYVVWYRTTGTNPEGAL